MEFDEEALLAQILESVGKKAPTKQLEVVTIQPSERPNPHLGDESNTEIKTVCPRVGEEIFWQLSTSFYKKVWFQVHRILTARCTLGNMNPL